MTTNDKGNIGLAKAISDLTVKGYQVFLPLTDTSIIDMIISNKTLTIKKLQVKYLSLTKDGSLAIPLESVINGKRVLNDFSNVDGFAIYCPDNDKMYYVSTKDVKTKTYKLKVTEHKRGYKPTRNAADFMDINNIFI
jgi:hypothetical protein